MVNYSFKKRIGKEKLMIELWWGGIKKEVEFEDGILGVYKVISVFLSLKMMNGYTDAHLLLFFLCYLYLKIILYICNFS